MKNKYYPFQSFSGNLFRNKVQGILLLLSFFLVSFNGQSQNQTKEYYQTKLKSNTTIGYLSYLPPAYKASNEEFPLMIFLHGLGQIGSNLDGLLYYGPPKLIHQGKWPADRPFVVISPQTPSVFGSSWNTALIDEVIEQVKSKYRIDNSRIYITGTSMGGNGTWTYAMDYPDKIAAVVPICGWGSTGKACNMKNVPTWAFHNDGDPTVNVSGTINMVNALKSCSASPSPKQVIYPKTGHDAWTQTYDLTSGHDIYSWMLSYTNGSAPAPAPVNNPPKANAGSDKTMTLPQNSVVLSGLGTDSDGSISSYTWSKVSGPSVSMSNSTTANLSLSNLVAGSYTFRLTVKDNDNATSSDEVKVTVGAEAVKPGGEGLSYSYYEGIWSSLPNFSSLNPNKTGLVSNFSLTPRNRNDNFSFQFTGFIQISSAGDYTFYINSDDGSQLFIDNKLVVDNNGLHGEIEKSGRINLSSGTHAIKITYFERTGGEVLEARYSGPGVSKRIIPDNVLFQQSGSSTNQVPTVNAGSDKTLTLPANNITLNGAASDSDGSISSYSWMKSSGPSATLSNTTSPNLGLSNLVTGSYTFRLTAKDNNGATAYDEVKVTVNGAADKPGGEGLTYAYYEGSWNQLPDFSKLRAKKTGSIANFSLSPALKPNYFGFKFNGSITISQSGEYTFYTASDDGSKLYINNEEIVNNDGIHGERERSGRVYLAAGTHQISVTYFDKWGSGDVLKVSYAGPGISKRLIPDSVLSGGSSNGSEEPPAQKPPSSENGISYQYYEGNWNYVPDFSKLKPKKSGTVSNYSLSPAISNSYFSLQFNAQINITKSGDYTFYTSSDDGSKLYVNGQEVVDNDGTHGKQERSGKITLTAGMHDIKVAYFEKWGNDDILDVRYAGPGISKQIIPSNILFLPSSMQQNSAFTTLGGTIAKNEEPVFGESRIADQSTVYPNPFTNEITVSLANDGFEGIVRLALLDLSGRLIYTKDVNADNYDINIAASEINVASGIYYLQIIRGSKKEVIKLIKN